MPDIIVEKNILITPVRYKNSKNSVYKRGIGIFILTSETNFTLDYWKTPYTVIPLTSENPEGESLFTTNTIGIIYNRNDLYAVQIEDERLSPRFSITVTEEVRVAL